MWLSHKHTDGFIGSLYVKPDSLIMAVLLIASIAIGEQDFTSAEIHMKAASELINKIQKSITYLETPSEKETFGWGVPGSSYKPVERSRMSEEGERLSASLGFLSFVGLQQEARIAFAKYVRDCRYITKEE